MPACLPACLPVCLYVCLPSCLPAYLPACLSELINCECALSENGEQVRFYTRCTSCRSFWNGQTSFLIGQLRLYHVTIITSRETLRSNKTTSSRRSDYLFLDCACVEKDHVQFSFFLSAFLRRRGSIIYDRFFNSSATWAATFRLRR